MSQQQPEKLTAKTTPEKNRYDKPFVQVEGELTEEQLEAIADGLMKLTTLYTSVHLQTIAEIVSAVLERRSLLWWWPQWVEIIWLGSWSFVGGVAVLLWRSLLP